MSRHIHSSPGAGVSRLKLLALLAACAAVLLLLPPLLARARQPSPAAAPSAQPSPQPSAEAPAPAQLQTTADGAGPVTAAGYSLERVSFTLDKWPTARFEFNLWNEAQEPFDQLKTSDIAAFFEGQKVDIPEGALQLTGSKPAPAHVTVLVDSSRSMTGAGGSVNKLAAAKDALRSFVSSLDEQDTLNVYSFDARTTPVTEGGVSNERSLISSIAAIKPSDDKDPTTGQRYSDSTDLYGAVVKMLKEAPSQKVRHLIVLSDGMQDTPAARRALDSPGAFETYKTAQERDIRQLAAANGVRLYTLAIGDKNVDWRHPDNLAYVDDDTLNNIANENQGGIHEYIDLPLLVRSAQTSSSNYESFLTEKLKRSLGKIRGSFHYGYSLELTLRDIPRDSREHVLEMKFPAGSNSTFPVVKYPLSWGPTDKVPQTGKPEVFTALFLDTPKVAVQPVNLGAVYTVGVGALGLLGVIPLLVFRVQKVVRAKADERAVSTAVIAVQKKSPYVGKGCPNDPTELIKPGDAIVVCPRCGRAHHLECWLYVKSRCMERYCLTELAIPEAVLKRHGLKSA